MGTGKVDVADQSGASSVPIHIPSDFLYRGLTGHRGASKGGWIDVNSVGRTQQAFWWRSGRERNVGHGKTHSYGVRPVRIHIPSNSPNPVPGVFELPSAETAEERPCA